MGTLIDPDQQGDLCPHLSGPGLWFPSDYTPLRLKLIIRGAKPGRDGGGGRPSPNGTYIVTQRPGTPCEFQVLFGGLYYWIAFGSSGFQGYYQDTIGGVVMMTNFAAYPFWFADNVYDHPAAYYWYGGEIGFSKAGEK